MALPGDDCFPFHTALFNCNLKRLVYNGTPVTGYIKVGTALTATAAVCRRTHVPQGIRLCAAWCLKKSLVFFFTRYHRVRGVCMSCILYVGQFCRLFDFDFTVEWA